MPRTREHQHQFISNQYHARWDLSDWVVDDREAILVRVAEQTGHDDVAVVEEDVRVHSAILWQSIVAAWRHMANEDHLPRDSVYGVIFSMSLPSRYLHARRPGCCPATRTVESEPQSGRSAACRNSAHSWK